MNAILLLQPAVADLMDRSPDASVLESIRSIATSVPGVLANRDVTFRMVDALLRDGHAVNPAGHQIRMVAFGSLAPAGHHRHLVVLLRDVVAFLRRYLRNHWDIVHRADFKDPAFSFLMMLEKAGCATTASVPTGGVS